MMPMMAACMFDAMKDIKSWSIAKGQSNILRRTLHVETPQSLIAYRFRMQVWIPFPMAQGVVGPISGVKVCGRRRSNAKLH